MPQGKNGGCRLPLLTDNIRLEDAFKKLTPCQKSLFREYIAQSREAVQSAMTEFTQSIYLHLLESEKENFVFSPLSLHSALSMLYLGTTVNSDTEHELGRAMGSLNSKLMVKGGYKQIVDSYKKEQNFLYGNNFWVQDGITVNPQFQKTVTDNLNSGVGSIDFSASNSTKIVNDWVNRMTNGKIEKIAEEFSPDTQFYLANALFFKEDWKTPFEDVDFQNRPLKAKFETPRGIEEVPMVQQINKDATYGEIFVNSVKVEVVSLPYKNDHFEMQIISPKSLKSLEILENKMNLSVTQDNNANNPNFFNLFSNPKNESQFASYIEEIYLKMPVFQARSDLDVIRPLRQLGAKKVFTSGAELGELAQGSNFGVSKISHTAVVEVTKEGTEGASATGVEIVLLSAPIPHSQVDVTVDGPFIFVVQDKLNKIPVLVGRIVDPTKKIP